MAARVYCEHCGQELKSKPVWLELDTRDGKYKKPEDVPVEHTQGGFPFGAACARTILK